MLKNNKGISLATMVITIIIMLIILSTLVYSSVASVKVRKLNKLYNDIRQLNDAVAVYYMKTGTLPVDASSSYTIEKDGTNATIAGAVLLDETANLAGKSSLVNPNDYNSQTNKAVYYKIDASKLENLSLNYNNTDDIYIINDISHTIYYVKGLSIDNEKYYTLPLSYRDMNYNAQYPVKSITLKSNGSTDLTIYMDAETGTTLNLLNFIQFNNNAKDGNGQPKTVTFTLNSNASNVVDVDSNGNVKVKDATKLSTITGYTEANKGKVPITVTCENYSTTDITNQKCSSTINIYLVGFSIKDTDSNVLTDTKMIVSNEKEIVIEKNKINGTESSTGTLNFSSDNENIAIIEKSSDGTKYNIKTGTEIGTATVTVTSTNGSISRSVKVTNYKTTITANSEEIKNSQIELSSIGSIVPLKVAVEGKDLKSSDVTVAWSVTNTDETSENVVDLRSDTTAAEGATSLTGNTVYLHSNSFGTAKVNLAVSVKDGANSYVIQELTYDVSVVGVKIVTDSNATATIKTGETLNLIINPYDTESTIETVTWSVASASQIGEAVISANSAKSEYVSIDASTGDVKIDVSSDETVDRKSMDYSAIVTAKAEGTVKVTAVVVLKKDSKTVEYTDTYTITIESAEEINKIEETGN
jgi:type II secretory pathway pseudopilin PulG